MSSEEKLRPDESNSTDVSLKPRDSFRLTIYSATLYRRNKKVSSKLLSVFIRSPIRALFSPRSRVPFLFEAYVAHYYCVNMVNKPLKSDSFGQETISHIIIQTLSFIFSLQ